MSDLCCKTHNLKTDKGVFHLSWRGKKPFEIRKNDRHFRTGEEMVLKETKYTSEEMAGGASLLYTGRRIRVKILSMVSGYGVRRGWVVMGVEELHRVDESN